MRRRCIDVAVEVLLDTDNPAVTWGDAGLLDGIFERWMPDAGKVHPLDRGRRVLNALDKAVARGDERFVKFLTNSGPPAGLVRLFRLSPICVEWAVRGKDGILTGQTFWCRAADQKFTNTGDEHVATDCGQVVTLPYGIERRPATCRDCLAGGP